VREEAGLEVSRVKVRAAVATAAAAMGSVSV